MSVNGNAKECDFKGSLNDSQKTLAYKVYNVGQAYDLGLTMVAVAYEESKLGKYKVRLGNNRFDQSFGVFHKVVYWDTKNMSAFNRGRFTQKILENDDFAIDVALKDLLHWRQVNKGSWQGMVESYNAGYGSNKKYLKKIIENVKVIKQCKWEIL